jgi:hypothetical protein
VLVEDTRAELSEMLADAMGIGAVTREHLEAGELIADVWAANVLAVVHRRATVRELRYRLRLTIDMMRRRRIVDVAPSSVDWRCASRKSSPPHPFGIGDDWIVDLDNDPDERFLAHVLREGTYQRVGVVVDDRVRTTEPLALDFALDELTQP